MATMVEIYEYELFDDLGITLEIPDGPEPLEHRVVQTLLNTLAAKWATDFLGAGSVRWYDLQDGPDEKVTITDVQKAREV